MTRARLFCKTGAFAGKEFEISSEAMIGRSQTNTVALSSDKISSHHARIFYDTNIGRFVLEDLGSSNGTRLDGMRIRSPEPLDALNVITIADAHDFIFQTQSPASVGASSKATAPSAKVIVEEKTMLEDAPVAPPPVAEQVSAEATMADEGALEPVPGAAQPSSDNERTMMDADVAAPPAPVDVSVEKDNSQNSPNIADERTIMDAEIAAPPAPPAPVASESDPPTRLSLHVPKTGASFPLTEGEHTLGRTEPCDIVIADSSISRKHAKLVVSHGAVTITDLGSKNGVAINGSKIQAPADIATGDNIRIGDINIELKQ